MKNLNMWKSIFFALSFIPHLGLDGITFEEAKERLLGYQIPLKHAELQVQIQRAQEVQASLWPNPSLTVEVDSFGGNRTYRGVNQAGMTYTYTQPVTITGRIMAQKKVASWNTLLAEWDWEITRQDLLLALKNGWIDAALAQEVHALNQQRVECSHAELATKEKPLDKKKGALNCLSVQRSAAKALQGKKDAHTALARQWGGETPDFEQVEHNLLPLQSLPPLEELKAQLENNPEYNKAAAAYGLAEDQLCLEKTKKTGGDIDLSAGVSTWKCDTDRAFFFEVEVPLPFYDRNQGNIGSAQITSLQALYFREALRIDLTTKLENGYSAWQKAYAEALDIEKQSLPLAQETHSIAETPEDKLDAQETLLDLREAYLNAAADAAHKRAEIERIIGNCL